MKLTSLSLKLPILFSLCVFSACKKDTGVSKEPPAPIVNAGLSRTITLPVDSVRLTGSATDSFSKITAYLWSEVSGPNVPVIASEGSPSTLVTGLMAGSYIFQLMAVDSLGHTGVDTLSVVVLAALKTDTLYTDTLTTGANPYELTFLSNPTSPAGNNMDIEFLAETWTVNGTEVYGRSFFKFDMSKIPAGATIKSAKLNLFSDPAPQNGDLIHANYGTNNDFYIQRVSSSWDLTNTTWNSLPTTDTTARVYIPQTNQSVLDLINVDVTAMTQNMQTSGNYGFMMQLKTEILYNSRIFCTSRYADVSRHPYLVVTY